MDRPTPGTCDELTKRNVETIARMEKAADDVRTFAERAADAIAHGVGSWKFLLIQTGIFAVYIVLNVVAFIRHWDPYPFILLNLFLSFQAAYTGPILMMSQNRQARLADRRNNLDLQVNLLAERETTEILHLLRQICEKQGIALTPGDEALEEAIEPEKMARQIDESAEKKKQKKG
jgi:uncharacterized membrane protein